ncbi:methionyl-tRNA formyltransferase [bacterium]|nr:methionyl-tRNA formyltransferase [bacterium]
MEPIKVLYIGTNWESLETLKVLDEDKRFKIIAVITQPDRPVGRKLVLTPTPVKQYALEKDIEVFMTDNNVKRYQEALDHFQPELIVCKAFGEIIPGFFLEYPKYKSINIHFSILPKYRGAVPIQAAILNGEKETGVTFQKMSEKFDRGQILKIIKEEIRPDDTNESLRKRLVEISAKALPNILFDWVNGKVKAYDQDESQATYCYERDLKKEKAEIKWGEMTAEYIERMVRAYIPWPVAWFMFEGKRTKLLKSCISELSFVDNQPYKVINKKLIFKTKEGFLELLELQLEGKSPVLVKDLVNSLK